jgi:hypothetical protein
MISLVILNMLTETWVLVIQALGAKGANNFMRLFSFFPLFQKRNKIARPYADFFFLKPNCFIRS